MDAAAVDACFDLLLADQPGARAAFAACHAAGLGSGSATQQHLAAAGVLLAIAADFDDFRGLPAALAQFAQGWALTPAAPRPQDCPQDRPQDRAQVRPQDRLRLAAAQVAVPLLDHGVAHDAPQVLAAVAQVFEALRSAPELSAGERVLMAKLLIDHAAMQNDALAVERVVAVMQPHLPLPGQPAAVSLAWQGRWWLVVASNADYFGQPLAAREARARAQRLADAGHLPSLRFELLCQEMTDALRADDAAGAERVFAQLEQLRPEVPPGRLPHGLRAQAAWHLWRGQYHQALARIDLLLTLCQDLQVPERDRGSYCVQRAYCLTGLRQHAGAIAQLEALRPLQTAGQADVLDALLAMARAVQALDQGADTARALVADALWRCQALGFNRFLMPLPAWAARVAEVGLQDRVATEFVTASVRARRLQPSDPAREDWPWRLQVQVLGELRLRRDGEPLHFVGKLPKKPLELLGLLAAHGGKPLPLALALDALWPSSEAGNPKAALEVALSRLRKLLDVPDAVLLGEGGLRLAPRMVWTDVAAFGSLEARVWTDLTGSRRHGDLTGGRQSDEGSDEGSDEAAACAQRAIALYRGPLLGTLALSAPVRALREQLARRFSRLVIGHGRALETRGHWREAADVYEQGLARDSLAEPIYRALMRVLLQLGERAEAMRTFARCRDLLTSALGVTPSHETWALREQAAGPQP